MSFAVFCNFFGITRISKRQAVRHQTDKCQGREFSRYVFHQVCNGLQLNLLYYSCLCKLNGLLAVHIITDLSISGLSCFAFVMVFHHRCSLSDPLTNAQVWLFVPSTNEITSLEEMSYVFGKPLRKHAQEQINLLGKRSRRLFTRPKATPEKDDTDSEASSLTDALYSFRFESAFANEGTAGAGTGAVLAPDQTREGDQISPATPGNASAG